MSIDPRLKIGITCHPTVGGSGILASALGEELAARGHEVHFICYERPFRLPAQAPRLYHHSVEVSDYGLFKYPDYTLPLSVKMAEVSREVGLDLLHVHYAVPHATAAVLARSMLPAGTRPRIVTTLHGTDTTLLGRDRGYGPAIRHALSRSHAITTVSEFLKLETQRLLEIVEPIDVIYNFFSPREPGRTRAEVRHELGLGDEPLLIHCSNLRPVKRIDVLLATVAQIRSSIPFKLLILAGEEFAPFVPEARRLGILDRLIVRERVSEIEEYMQAADLGLFTSDSESFCLGILEAMCFGCPSVSTRVGGVPEVVDHGITGLLAAPGDPAALARLVENLLDDSRLRIEMGRRARETARRRFAASTIVEAYEALYRRVLSRAGG